MKETRRSLWKATVKRLVVYGGLLGVVALASHFYVTEPLFFKKLPYRAEAYWAGFDISCESGTPEPVRAMLREVSLPYFSLTGEVRYIDQTGKAYGCQVFDDSERDDAAFRLASLTKAVTALAVLSLADEGKIDLEARLLSFFPEVDPEAVVDPRLQQVTLSHLLSHSSGFGGVFGSDNMAKKGETPWCPYNFRKMEKVRLAGKPGSNHVYSNVSYCLLGEVIARVTGLEYREYILQRYLAQHSGFAFVDGSYLPAEPEYDLSNEQWMGSDYFEWLDFYALSSAAGLIGDPAEFARLVWEKSQNGSRSLLGGPLVDSCWEREEIPCYSYPMKLYKSDGSDTLVGIQRGYLPGASSMLAVNDRGKVLVWTAAGAAVSQKAKQKMIDRVVAFLSSP